MTNDKRKLATIAGLLMGILWPWLYAVEEGDLMDELVSATKSHDREKAKQVSEKLAKMGDDAIPLIERGIPLLEKGFDLENRALAGYIMQVLKNIKTKASTKMLLDLTGRWKDTREGEYYIVGDAMYELESRDIDVEVDKEVLDFMLRKLQEGNLFTAPRAGRILGKMKKVEPTLRTEACISALKKEVSRESDVNTPQELLPSSYVSEAQYKIRQYIFALEDIGAPAIPFISDGLRNIDAGNYKEYLTICLCLAGGKKTPSPEVKSEIVNLAKSSSNGYIRALGIRVLSEWEDKTLVPMLKDALKDDFKIAVKPDKVSPDMRKGADGRYYYDYYPVASEAFSALRKLGVKVVRQGSIFRVPE